MAVNWILFLLGTFFYFWQRYWKRTKKTIGFSFKFWLRDNAQEFGSTVILDIVAMIILLDDGTIINLAKYLPEGWNLPGNLIFAFAIGAGLGKVCYEIFKSKFRHGKNST